MMHWARQHRAAFGLGLRGLIAAPATTLFALLSLGIALALPFGTLVLFMNAEQLIANSGALPQITVFMKRDADRAATDAIADELLRHPAVAAAQLLGRETTLAHMRQTEGLSDVIAALPHNPFPDALVITPRDTRTEAMERLVADLRQRRAIEHVQIDSAWIARMNAIFRLGRVGLGTLAAILLVGAVATALVTLRLQVLTRRGHEARADAGAERRAWLYSGTLHGLLAGMAAWLIVAAAISLLAAPMSQLARLYGTDVSLAGPGATLSLFFLAMAAAMGWLGTVTALSRRATPPRMH